MNNRKNRKQLDRSQLIQPETILTSGADGRPSTEQRKASVYSPITFQDIEKRSNSNSPVKGMRSTNADDIFGSMVSICKIGMDDDELELYKHRPTQKTYFSDDRYRHETSMTAQGVVDSPPPGRKSVLKKPDTLDIPKHSVNETTKKKSTKTSKKGKPKAEPIGEPQLLASTGAKKKVQTEEKSKLRAKYIKNQSALKRSVPSSKSDGNLLDEKKDELPTSTSFVHPTSMPPPCCPGFGNHPGRRLHSDACHVM